MMQFEDDDNDDDDVLCEALEALNSNVELLTDLSLSDHVPIDERRRVIQNIIESLSEIAALNGYSVEDYGD